MNRPWLVAGAGIGINLALGVLYSWSIFKLAIKDAVESGGAFRWDLAQLNDPYSVACLVFAFSMIPAGRLQDRVGPRRTALLGGILVGAGLLLASRSPAYGAWVLGFGVLTGMGIGFAYSAATPPALKWFPPAKTGLIAGLVVSGFGIASVYIAPLSKHLIADYGLQKALAILGVAFMLAIAALSRLLVNPPAGYRAAGAQGGGDRKAGPPAPSLCPGEMLRTRGVYLMWLTFFISAGCGLMVIGSVGELAKGALGEAAFLAVVMMAIGNAGGRITAGIVSDRVGPRRTLMGILGLQMVMMIAGALVVRPGATAAPILLLATLIGFNYGGNLSIFPAMTKSRFGLANFGANYGIVFTAWGVGGFALSRLSQMLYAGSHSYTSSFLVAAALLAIGCLLSVALAWDERQATKLVEQKAA